jgi:N-acetylglutamate synthase/N-acetylornithine aminotransferase
VLQSLEELINKDCTFNLQYMRDKIKEEFDIDLALSTIATKLNGMLYTTNKCDMSPILPTMQSIRKREKSF